MTAMTKLKNFLLKKSTTTSLTVDRALYNDQVLDQNGEGFFVALYVSSAFR
jgi:hypothetical protein